MRHAGRAVLLILLLLTGATPSEAQGGNVAPPPTVRLYGCADDITTHDDEPPILGPDGVLDCTGDLLRFRPAWLASGQNAGTRAALGARDQRMDMTLRYAPTYWAPAPASGANDLALQRPGAPGEGLFDDAPSGVKGTFDASFVFDETHWPHLDTDDTPDPVDFDPHDGLPDRADRHDGGDARADRYGPALEARIDLTWWDATGRQTNVPDGQSLVFAPIDTDASSGAEAWAAGQAPTGLRWSARPFGHGTTSDGLGAVVTPTLTARIGDTLRFLDHQIVLVGFLGDGEEPAVVVDIQHVQGRTPVTIASGMVLNRTADGHQSATVNDPGISPWNAVTADGVQATRRIPNLGGAGGAWFAYTEGVDDGDVRLRLGRWIGTTPEANAFIVARSLHTIHGVNETNGALRGLAWSRVLPLGADLALAGGLELGGHSALSALPLPVPFGRDHVSLDDIRPKTARTPYGFLQGTTAAAFTSSELRLSADALTPQERARRAEPIEIVWHHRGDESRLGGLHRMTDDSIVRTLVVPFRYVAIGAPTVPALLHSALLDDEGLLVGASGLASSPRGARSFVVQANDVFSPYVDGGLRLYGGTLNRPDSADVLRLGHAWLPADGGTASPRQAGAAAGQAIELDARFQPFHSYSATPASPVPRTDEAVDASLDGDDAPQLVDGDNETWPDNLADVVGENTDVARGAPYGPALQLRYTSWLATPEGTPTTTPFGNRTRIVVPMADRDAAVSGLDSLDADGDGSGDALVLARFWDRDSGTDVAAHWGTAGPYEASHDFIDLQTPPILLPSGADLRLFDHGLRFTAGTQGGPGTFDVLDMSGPWGGSPPVLDSASLADAPAAQCLVVTRDHEVTRLGCTSVAPAAATAPYTVEGTSAVWWAEVLDVGPSSAQVRLHRMVSPEALFVSGVRYAWSFETDPTGALERWRLTADVPLGGVMPATSIFGERILVPHAPSRPLSVLPPFDLPYLRVDRSGAAARQDPHGFDLDSAFATAAQSARLVGPLVVRTAGLGTADAHRFVHLDPTRLLDPARSPGHAFVGGVFAAPTEGVGLSTWAAPLPPSLRFDGPDGFDGAIRSAGDRGWDHFVRLVLPAGHAPYRMDSVRIGGGATSVTANDGGAWRGAAATPWLFDPAVQLDLYAADRPSPGPSPITPSPPATPADSTAPTEPSPTEGSKRGSPDVAAGVTLLALVVVALLWTRKRP